MADSIGIDPVAWSIDGGRHPADLLRLVAFAGTRGAEGIVNLGDFKVHQLGAAGGQVVIDPGALLIRVQAGTVANQTYVVNGRLQSLKDVSPNPSGAPRSDLLVIRVEDPQFGWPEPAVADKPTYQYVKPFIVENVPPTTKTAKDLDLGYSAVAIARIDLPAGTTNITDAMIVDLRKVANPRSDTNIWALNNSGIYTLNSTALIDWPLDAAWPADIPEWATVATVRALFTQIDPIWSTIDPEATNGWITVVIGAGAGAVQADGTVWEIRSANEPTMTIGIGDTVAIPAAMRGTTQTIRTRGNRNDGNAALRFNAGSSVILDVTFKERAA